MTNEEAITNLNIIREAVEDYVCNYLTDTAKAQKILNALQDMEQQPSDTVSRGAYEQVMWERDVAIGQLKELGYGLGQKIEPCDNAISREAVYSILNEHHIDEDRIKSDMDERQNLTVNSIASDVSLLPSVTQKSAESEDKTE